MAEAEDLVRGEAARGAVVIPVDFERSIQRGEQVVVGVFGDASYFMVYSQIATGAGQAAGTLAAGIRIRRLQASGANEDRARKARNPLPIDLHPLYNPSGGYGNYLVPAVLILILQQTLLIGIGTLAGTRREQAGTAKVQPSVLVECLGQAMTYTGVYLVNAAVVFTVVFRVFDLPSHGPLLRLLVFLLPFLIAVSFLGLTLAAFFRSRESALQALMFTCLPAIFVSGFSFPREAMPRCLQWGGQILPSTHGIAGGLRIFQMDATLHDVQAPVPPPVAARRHLFPDGPVRDLPEAELNDLLGQGRLHSRDQRLCAPHPSGWRVLPAVMLLAGLLGGVLPLSAQESLELGPFPTRDMFPLFLSPMVYQPVDPTPVGRGRWRVSLDQIRANTFEFSEILKDQAPRDAQGRVAITREYILARATEYASVPVIFFFDEEIIRTSLRVRFGLSEHTDFWAELPFQSHSGGFLDGVIEGFHSLGFEQFGRDRVQQDQLTLMVMTHGQLLFYSDQAIRGKMQDPTLGLMHRIGSGPTWTLSAYASLKPPLTTTYNVYRSGWDHSVGITGHWGAAPHHSFYWGGGFIRRPAGSVAYNHLSLGRIHDAWGAHGTWEYRRWKSVRPFFQLYAQSGNLPQQLYQKLDRPSLQHDLGFHWQFQKDTVLTFRYLNNISHNANTADMGLGLSLTTRF